MWPSGRLALACAALALSGAAEAGELEYAAPAACPDARGFADALAVRGAELSASELAIDVSIIRGGDVFEGELRLGDGAELHAVKGSSCGEVVEALALVLSLAIEAETGGRGAGAAETSSDASPEPDAQGSERTPRRGGDAATSFAEPSTAVRKGPPGGPERLRVGAHAMRVAGVVPGQAIAGHVFFELPLTWPLRLVLARADSELTLGEGAAGFRWTAGRIDLCPFSRDALFYLAGCAAAEGGLTEVETRGVPEARRVGRPWLSAGTALRTGLQAGAVRFEIEAAALAPLRRDYYQLRPSMTVHRTSIVSARLGVGLAVRIW